MKAVWAESDIRDAVIVEGYGWQLMADTPVEKLADRNLRWTIVSLANVIDGYSREILYHELHL